MTQNSSSRYVSGACAFALLLAAYLYPAVRAQSRGGDPCASNLKQLAVAVSGYTQDYDGALPPMGTPSATDAAVSAYLPKSDAVRCPVTGMPYRPNAALSAQSIAKLPKPSATYLFRDAVAHPGGRFTVLYADGHVVHLAKKPHGKD